MVSRREAERELKGTKNQSHHLLLVGFGKGNAGMQQLTVELDVLTGFFGL